MAWRLADAKNRFSELVNRALRGDPQVVMPDATPWWWSPGAITKS